MQQHQKRWGKILTQAFFCLFFGFPTMHHARCIYSEEDSSGMKLETMTPFSLWSNSSPPCVCVCSGPVGWTTLRLCICWLRRLSHALDTLTTEPSSFIRFVRPVWRRGKCSTHPSTVLTGSQRAPHPTPHYFSTSPLSKTKDLLVNTVAHFCPLLVLALGF